MKNRVLALFLALTVGLSVAACGSKEKDKEVPTVTVSGILPAQGDVIVETAYIGTVEPQQSVTVFPMVSGNVTQLQATLRQTVKRGDVLFSVDNTEASRALEEAQKELEIVKKEAETARKEAEEAAKEAETAKKEAAAANLKVLEEKVNTAKTALDAAQKNWDKVKKYDLDDLEDELEDLEDDYEEDKSSLSSSEKSKRREEIQEVKDKISEYNNAKAALSTAQTTYDAAYKAWDDAKKAASSTGTSSGSSNNGATNADKTTEHIQTIYDEKLAAAEKKVEEAQIRLSMYQVKAPFDGVVEAVYIEADEKVFEDTACVVVSNTSNMEVTFQVPEATAKELHTGEVVRVEKDGGLNEARITEVGVMADPETKLFTVKASLGAVYDFSTGATVTVYAETQKALGVMKIPYDALYFQSGAAYVYCIVDDEAVRREVQVGLMNEESAEILEGLGEHDVVISTWSSQLKDGAEVNLLFVIGYEEPVTEEDMPLETPSEEIFENDGNVKGEWTGEEHQWILPNWP